MFLPEEDRLSYSKERLESNISSMFGGRIAEELIFGKEAVTTGASNDIQRATEIARNMVTKWGFSEKLGPLMYGDEEGGEVFLGHSMGQNKSGISDETSHIIDKEIRAFADRNYERSTNILKAHEKELHMMAEALLKYETIDSSQIDNIMEGRDPGPPKGWTADPEDNDADVGGGSAVEAATDSDDVVKDKKDGADGKLDDAAEQH